MFILDFSNVEDSSLSTTKLNIEYEETKKQIFKPLREIIIKNTNLFDTVIPDDKDTIDDKLVNDYALRRHVDVIKYMNDMLKYDNKFSPSEKNVAFINKHFVSTLDALIYRLNSKNITHTIKNNQLNLSGNEIFFYISSLISFN